MPIPLRSTNSLETVLRNRVAGEILFDAFSRGRYATDASVYQMMPLGVVVPESLDDVREAISIARSEGISLLARGAGTSQCGQSVNTSLVLDTTRHLNRVLELDVENRRCVVEPGIVLDELNRILKPHGLWFPVDVSTSSRATIGGMAGNNSCGARSIRYGTMRDNVIAIDALLGDGSSHHFGPIDRQAHHGEQLVRELLALGEREADEIARRFPTLMRRVGGYNIDALVPSNHPTNLSHLLVGSEGTLAYSTAIELKLSDVPPNRVLGVCHFPTFYKAMEAAQHLVTLDPLAVELIDRTMIGLARDIPVFEPIVRRFVRGDPDAILLVEFSGEEREPLTGKLNDLESMMGSLGFSWQGKAESWGGVVRAEDAGFQSQIWEVRKSGLNIMMSMKQDGKPISFVEDCAVELPDLAEFTARLTEIFEKYGTRGTWYAHASVGCLHVRPVLNLKLDQDVKAMRAIAEEAFELVRHYKGSHSGEHGDGIVRSEFHEAMFGARMVRNFEEVKARFDPGGLFNPNKIVHAPKMDDRSLLRFKPGYRVSPFDNALNWSEWTGAGGGFQGAVEMCNNNGACRKLTAGVMCPSFRVTRREEDLTRGRANTLRLAISGQLGPEAFTSDQMMHTMKLCVSCKGCKRECPTGVDMARMKIEVQAARARKYGLSLHDKLVGYLPRYAPYLSRLSPIANLRNRIPGLAALLERPTGFAAERALPIWSSVPFRDHEADAASPDVALFADTFNRYFEPENLRAGLAVLRAAGLRIKTARPLQGGRPLCCGRTLLSVGLVNEARKEAQRLIDALLPYAQRGTPVVGLEPSCVLSLRDEIKGLLPGKACALVATNTLTFEEYVSRETETGRFSLPLRSPARKVLVHGHCHQKAYALMSDVARTLALLPETKIETIESSCCGMAGAFGYAADTHEVSIRMGELNLLPAVRAAQADTLIVADGTSCRHQIEDGTARKAIHVARILEMALKDSRSTP